MQGCNDRHPCCRPWRLQALWHAVYAAVLRAAGYGAIAQASTAASQAAKCPIALPQAGPCPSPGTPVAAAAPHAAAATPDPTTTAATAAAAMLLLARELQEV